MKSRCTLKMGHALCLCALLVAGLGLLSACTPNSALPVAMTSGPRAWLDQPPDGFTLPLGRFTLKAHANAEGERVRAIRFNVNGMALSEIPTDPAASLAYAEFEWNPSIPGRYVLQAVALAGAAGEPANATVCVEAAPGSGCPEVAGATPQATAPPVVSPGASPLSEKEIVLTTEMRTKQDVLTKEAASGGVTVSPEKPLVTEIGVVFGTVKSDLNEDGAGEDPLAGVTVAVSGCDTGQGVTGADGTFGFKVPAGTCYLTVSLPEWDFIGAAPGGSVYPAVAVVRGNAETQLTILMYNKKAAIDLLQKQPSPTVPQVSQVGVVYGTVKSDLNEDGVGEDPLAGVTVAVSGCDAGQGVTGADGAFGFKVPAGTCYLTVSKPEWDFIGATPGGSVYPVASTVVGNAETQLTIFMYNKKAALDLLKKQPPPVTPQGEQIGELVGTVAFDSNGNGNATDRGEYPLAGVQVTLGQCGTGQMVTGADGSFGFKSPAGNCQLQVYLPGWDFAGAAPSGAVYPVPALVRTQTVTRVNIFMFNKKAAIDLTPYAPPKVTDTPTIPPKQGSPDINFWADATQIDGGQCTQLHWNVNNVSAVYLNYGGKQSGVVGQGSQQVCPQGNGEAYQLIVILTDGTQKVAEIWIGVTNPKEAPPPPPSLEPKEIPKEIPKEVPTEIPKEIPKEVPK